VFSVSSEADGKQLDISLDSDVAVGMIAQLEEASNPIKKRYRRRSSAPGQYRTAERGR
jgi:hypothetical protein